MRSFLQTKDWLNFQKSIGRKTWRYEDGGFAANIIQHDFPFGMNYLYIPHGPQIRLEEVGGLKNELEKFFNYLKNIAREEKSIFVKFEPLQDSVVELIYDGGLRKSSKEVQARKTVILDLARSEDELLAGMHHKTRYNIKVAEKHNISVDHNSDIDALEDLLHKTAKRQKFHTHPKGYYKKLFEFFRDNANIKSDILLATYEGKAVAGVLYLTHGETCYYLHGGSDYQYRQLMAPYALHWSAIKFLNKKGIKHYDFGGSEGDKWPGVTRFKLSWGGRQVEHPGSFDLPVRKFWYFAYNIARKIL